MSQYLSGIRNVLRAVIKPHLETRHHKPRQSRINRWLEVTNRGQRRSFCSLERIGGRLQGQRVIQRRAERVEVRGGRKFNVFAVLLERRVHRGQQPLEAGALPSAKFDEAAEIDQLDALPALPFPVEHDVGGFDVAV